MVLYQSHRAVSLLALSLLACPITLAQSPPATPATGSEPVTGDVFVADGAVNGSCTVQTREFTLDIDHDGTDMVVVDVEFCAPVSLGGVSVIALDTLIAEVNSTSGMSQEFSFEVDLLAQGEPVGSLTSASGSQSGSVTSKRNYILRTIGSLPNDVAVDGIRLRSTVSSTSLSVRYRGAYGGDRIRAHFARGSFDTGGCHATRLATGAEPVTINGSGTSPWTSHEFAPLSMHDLHFIWAQRPGFNISNAFGDSFDIEAQLLLDDGTTLQMDNWSIPGASGPPEQEGAWVREVRRTITYPECEVVDDRSIIGWRWRVHKSGPGNLTILPDDPIILWALRKPCAKPGDLTNDGVVDVADLLVLLSQWGACPAPENCPADITGDCNVGISDLLILLGAWG